MTSDHLQLNQSNLVPKKMENLPELYARSICLMSAFNLAQMLLVAFCFHSSNITVTRRRTIENQNGLGFGGTVPEYWTSNANIFGDDSTNARYTTVNITGEHVAEKLWTLRKK